MTDMLPRLLVVDGDERDRQWIVGLLSDSVQVVLAESATQARSLLSSSEFNCALVGYSLPDTSGELFLKELAQLSLPAIVLTRQGKASHAVASMKAGAYDYLVKETLDRATLTRAIAKALEKYALETGLQRKQKELEASHQALRASESQFRVLVENITECFWMASADRRDFHYIGPQVENILGVPAAVLQSRPGGWLGYVHEQDRPTVERQWSGDADPYEFQYRVRASDGQLRWIRERSSIVVNADGDVPMVVGALEDISQRRDLEEQLFQSQKMEALGRLAGGVAHDFNNLLTCIIGYADLVLGDLKQGTLEHEDVARIRKAGMKGERLVRQLLSFSRRQPIQSIRCDLTQNLKELEHLLRRLIGEDIVLELHPTKESMWAPLDSTRAEQIILNLAVNARDAMPKGGRLVISLEPGEQSTVLLTVTDTGVGMSEQVQQRIFEPFFTSGKEQGTGLGLSTIFGIVSQAEGSISVESRPGEGSRFSIRLPRLGAPLCADAPDSRVATALAPECVGRNGQGILVVEDQDDVRELILRVLRRDGYSVFSASHGREGLSVFRNQREQVDLVISDLVMPEMNGVEMFAQMESTTPVLFVSGYSQESLKPEIHFPAATLVKPFTSAKLLNEVRARLNPL